MTTSASTSLVALHALPLGDSLAPDSPLSDASSPVKRKPGRPRKQRLVAPPPSLVPPVPTKLLEKARRNRHLSLEEKHELRRYHRRLPQNVYERIHRQWQALRRRMDDEIQDRKERLRSWHLPPHMVRPLPPMPVVERPADEVAEHVERKFMRQFLLRCRCATCRRMYGELKTPNRYSCRVFNCKQKFTDIADFLEHQLDAHSVLTPYCRRVREEFYRQHQGQLTDPPETVYIRAQVDTPWERPSLWTMEQVEQEAVEFAEHGKPNSSLGPRTLLHASFLMALKRVRLYGEAELKEQHRVALEHFESMLVFPTNPRSRRDVFGNVGVGRNWLLSPEPENADRSRLLKIAMAEAKGAERGNDGWESDSDEDEEVLLEVRTKSTVKKEEEDLEM